MANKFLTTQNKKIAASVALAIVAWHTLFMGSNPLNLPAMPGIFETSIFGGFTLLAIAAIITVLAIIMIWTEY